MTAQPAAKSEKAYGLTGKAPFVCIHMKVLEKLAEHIQAIGSDTEACGVLVGRRTKNGHIEIEHASEPQPLDERSRFSVFRKNAGHQGFVLKHWRSSIGDLDYVGEWHTHPEDHPIPSTTDHLGWTKCWLFHNRKSLVHLIQGRESLAVFRQTGVAAVRLDAF